MSHELVFNAAGKALMGYVSSNGANLPWHGLGHGFTSAPSLDEMANVCGFDRTIDTVPLEFVGPNGKRGVFADKRAVVDSEGRALGVVGDGYRVLQDSDMIASLRPWVDAGYASVETGGMVANGSRVWCQLRLTSAEFEVAPGDSIRTFLMVSNSHDGSQALVSGLVEERIICRNTLNIALAEDGLIRMRHKGVRDMADKAVDLQAKVFALVAESAKRAEAYRFLAETKVDAKGVDAFLVAVLGEKQATSKRDNGPADRIRDKFLGGIGNSGQNYWHLLNAVTEDATHNLGNVMKGDGVGDREGRALNRLFFGQGGALLAKATQTAMKLAQAA